MKKYILLIAFSLTFPQSLCALEFEGAPLTENEIYLLWDKNNCSTFMVNSASSKSAMPNVLADYLNSDPSYQEVKVISCTYKNVGFELYLVKKDNVWVMFNGEAITIESKE